MRREVAPATTKLAKALLLQWVVCMLKMSRCGKRNRGFVKVTSVMSMYHNKSKLNIPLGIQDKSQNTMNGVFFRGIFRAFLRVALKALHHTREAISTAKSIRALSVHKISQSMKLDSGIKHTQSRQHDMKHKK